MDSTGLEPTASEVNRELTKLLAAVGSHLGFSVVLEYPVPGGRLDVVWTWRSSTDFPGLDHALPVVGFEIESSWRTRKHVKGDLLNLQDAGVALGVIVLAGSSDKDEPLRTFARRLVDRPGASVLIWTAEDVRGFASRALRGDAADLMSAAPTSTLSAPPPTPTAPPNKASAQRPSALAAAAHAGKYASLHRWLVGHESHSITLTFSDVEDVLGFPLPNSCRSHVTHWNSYEGSAVARAIVDAGWKARRVSLADQRLTLQRLS